MQLIVILYAILLLTGCAPSQQPTDDEFVRQINELKIEPTAQPSVEGNVDCFTSSVDVCFHAISPHLSPYLASSSVDSFNKYQQPSIDGKFKSSGIISVSVDTPQSEGQGGNLLTISYKDHSRIDRVVATTSAPFEPAESDDDYNKTAVFELANMILDSKKCEILKNKHSFYLFIHQKVVPTKYLDHPTESADPELIDYYDNKTATVPVCGHHIRFSDAVWRDVKHISADNPKGVVAINIVAFTP